MAEVTIDKALDQHWSDFEDAIHYQAAIASGCQAIITRNPNDFEQAKIEILTPPQFLESIESSRK